MIYNLINYKNSGVKINRIVTGLVLASRDFTTSPECKAEEL